MVITVNLYYTGENGAARKFAEESPEIAAQMVRSWLRDGGDQP